MKSYMDCNAQNVVCNNNLKSKNKQDEKNDLNKNETSDESSCPSFVDDEEDKALLELLQRLRSLK